MKKNISILGATGSIGASALKICEIFSHEINLIGITTNKNIDSFLKIIDKFKPKYAVISDGKIMYDHFKSHTIEYNKVKIYSGKEGLKLICADRENDIIINAISGKAGLFPSLEIAENNINLACANKESIVCAGTLLNELCKKNNKRIIPIDSEHSAIFHLLKDRNLNDIAKIYLTASGGPFFKLDKKKWDKITIADALKHPTWKMGNKITIDSATMANKGLEIMEAHYLFNIDYDKINVLVHPQSLIHSMIETNDGEIYAQLGPNDMSIPIQNAVFYPEIKRNNYNRFDFSKHLSLEFYPMDYNKYKMLSFAFICGRKGNVFTAFYNFLNELLVNLFLNNIISFIQIEEFMEKAIELFEKNNDFSFMSISKENIKLIDKQAEIIVNKLIKELYGNNNSICIEDYNSGIWI
ncbi:MAG: 1-deoxy-D-xylulose-5-phosphate reductoisomerase [Spirochaetes bacterium]|nr:1-deoxy-D-xylulose-5-phosphate reductoisomerase [Spirochaetota bacterium]